MGDVIVTFRSKKDPEFVTPPVQIQADLSAEQLERFLNELLSQNKTYAFFHKNKQIFELPKDSGEKIIDIEYLAVAKIERESAKIEMDATITAISIRRNPDMHTDSIIICTVKGETKEISLSPGLEQLRRFESFKPIRAVTSTEDGIYVLTTTDKVVDIEEAKIVFEDKHPIRSISGSGEMLAIALSSDEIVLMKNNTEVHRIKTTGEIGKVILRKNRDKYMLICALVEGIIEVYKGVDWKKKTITLSRPITAVGYEDGKMYIGGIGGTITVCSLSQIDKEYQSDIDFISRIECGTIFFGYTNENRIFIRDKTNFIGTHLIELDQIVTDIKISGKRLFVAEGSTLKIFTIFDE